MKISFHGACKEVTGSCALVETEKYKFLVDCGSFQGEEFSTDQNADPFSFNSKEIDFVLLTHAHLDHCGRLPKLLKEGFNGKIYATGPTKELVSIILLDAAKIMSEKQGIDPSLLFTEEDVEKLLEFFVVIDHKKEFVINEDIKFEIKDSGHILGSVSFRVFIKDSGITKKIVFSGDLGNPPAPIIKDTEFFDGADIVIVESTYGGLTHEDREIGKRAIRDAINDVIKKKGVLIIPVFAVERSQEILYELKTMVDNNLIQKVRIFFDSPMAINALDIYKKYLDFYDDESRALVESGKDIFNFRGMELTPTPDDSKKINSTNPPKVILAGSGMCNGGRVLHHLKFNLENPKTHVMLLSFQAKNTLGRKLMDGEKLVTINDESIKVKAKISTYGCFSSHADEKKLEKFITNLENPIPKNIFINHGEEDRSLEFLKNLKKMSNNNIIIPEFQTKYEV